MKYICKWCNKEFETTPSRRIYENKFCCLSHQVSYKNTLQRKGIYVKCNNCGKDKYIMPGDKSNKHFCNMKCLHTFTKRENHPSWHGGYSSEYGRGWKEQRRLTIERDKHCKSCGKENNLDVHHIIPYQLSKSNKLDNLLTLCKSCHSSIGNTYWKIENRPQYFETINSMRL